MRNALMMASLVSSMLLPSALLANEMHFVYQGKAVAWPVTEAPIKTQLCVTLSARPSKDAHSELVLVTPAPAQENGWQLADENPWPQLQWGSDARHCFEAPLSNKHYTIAVKVGDVLEALTSNTVLLTDNPVGGNGSPPSVETVPSNMASQHQQEVMASARAHAAKELRTTVVTRSILTGRANVTLYFLPDGSPAQPIPTDLSERDEIRIKVLVPRYAQGSASLNVTACPDEVPFRVDGTYKQAMGFAQGRIEIVEEDLGQLHCGAGQSSFEIRGPEGARSTSLKLGEVYSGTIALQFTFDFTRTGALSTGRDATGNTVIRRSDDVLGPRVVPTFVWHPLGYDPHHPSVLGVLVNPSLGVDVDNVSSSLYLGDQLCGVGVCLAAGLHLRKVDELTEVSGLSEGARFETGSGSLPLEKRWSTKHGGVGAFLGATLDINVAAKLLSGS